MCRWCNRPIVGKYSNAIYCSSDCRWRFNNEKNRDKPYSAFHKDYKPKAKPYSLVKPYRDAHRAEYNATESRYKARKRTRTIYYSLEQLGQKFDFWGNRCWLCGDGSRPLTKDHVKPMSKGGWDVLSNIRPACQSCNSSKSNKWPLNALKPRQPIYAAEAKC